MSFPENIDEISSLIQAELADASFRVQTLTPLSGGNANFVFLGKLTQPLRDGTHEILVKHGEAYTSGNRSFEIPTSRCVVESECLAQLSSLAASANEWCSVRTPKLHHFDPSTNTQVQEYLPDSIDLKNYALKYLPPQTPPALKEQCLGIGRGLGSWLRRFHAWAALPEQSGLRKTAADNRTLQQIKHRTYYEWALATIDRYPGILANARSVFEEIKAVADEELADDDKLQVVHGDFWTGNALLPKQPIDTPVQTPMFIIDWEVLSLGVPLRDVGQMVAELAMLQLFKDITAGTWLVEGFLEGYGNFTRDEALRIAIHVGCHLVVIGGSVPGWGSQADIERVVAFGRDTMLRGWEKDAAWFKGSVLGRLFEKP
ncbi:hypothetical protein OQA88_6995 [Cercophora sp. LCS_1]